MKKVITSFIFILFASITFAKDYPNLLKTYISNNTVSVKDSPSEDSNEVCSLNHYDEVYVAGFSGDKDKDDNYWIKIGLYNFDDDYIDFSDKWIKTTDIIQKNIKPSIMTPTCFSKKNEYDASLKLNIKRGDRQRNVEVPLTKLDGQKFYTFVWNYDYYNPDFNYQDIVGTYLYDPVKREIKHISTIGEVSESKGSFLTNDLRYLMKDSGTSINIRGIDIYDLKNNNELIFSGLYSRDLDYDGEGIVVVDVYREDDEELAKETKIRAKAFINTLLEEDLQWQNVIVRYRFNFETREKEYIDCALVGIS